MGTATVAVLTLLAAGCGGADSGADATSAAEPTAATESASDAVAWAGGVCEAADALRTSIDDVGSSLEVDITGEGDALEQVRDQLAEQVQVVGQDVTELTSALAAVPTTAEDEDVVAARDDLQQSRDDLQAAVDELSASVEVVQDAAGAGELAGALAQATTAFVATRAALTAFADDVQAVSQAGGDAARAAFEQAPSCVSAGFVQDA
jgi:prephenate dehydratase